MDVGRQDRRQRRPDPREVGPALGVLVIGITVTLLAALGVQRGIDLTEQIRFREARDTVQQAILQRMEMYVATLRAAQGLFVRGPVAGEDFGGFAQRLALQTRYPGIQGIGFAERLRREDLARHPTRRPTTIQGAYPIWPMGPRPDYFPIVLLEPLDWRNRRALGYDMFTDPTRHAAMARAWETGLITATGRVELVQEVETDKQAGFLIYVPVYDTIAVPPSPALRRQHLIGFVYSPFRAGDLMHHVLARHPNLGVDVEVYDGGTPSASALLFNGGGDLSALRPAPDRLAATLSIAIAQRRWTLHVAALPTFATDLPRYLPFYTFGAGAAVSMLLALITWSQARGRRVAEQMAEDLRQSEQSRQSLLLQEKAARNRAAFLAEASRILGGSLDLQTTLDSVARLSVPRIADWCLIDGVDEAGQPVPLIAVHGDAARQARGLALRASLLLDPGNRQGVVSVLRTGQPQFHPQIDPAAAWVRTNPVFRRLIDEFGLRSAVIVPLTAHGRRIGALTLLLGESGRTYGPADLELAESLAGRVALAMDNSRLYEQALKARQEAEGAVRVRDEFLSIASHELRTPITSLQLHLDATLRRLRREAGSEPGAGWLLGKLEGFSRQIERLTTLINEMLDVSRITAGRLRLEREPLDMAEVLDEMVQRFLPESSRVGSPIAMQTTSPLPGQWDRMRLEQIISNLLSNALKYGAGKPIEVQLDQAGDRARLTVTDHGIGIDPADQARIFERFERLVSARHYGGFGLGLWIVRQVVEAHGGTITVVSTPGRGAVFTVVLPLQPPEAAERAA